jgi:hypothetical protein
MTRIVAKEKLEGGADESASPLMAGDVVVRTRPAGGGMLAGIGALPMDLRRFVNQSLFAGLDAQMIAGAIRDKGAVEITEADVSQWRETGFCEWQRERERIELLKLRSETVMELVKEFSKRRNAITSLNEMLLASQLNDALQDVNIGVLKEALVDKPELYFRLASAVNEQASERTRRRKLKLEFKKYRDSVREQKEKILEATRSATVEGLSPEALAKIEEAAALL